MNRMRIGIDVGGTKIEGVLLDGIEVVERERELTPQADGYDAILEEIRRLVDRMRGLAGQEPPIGVCTPGAASPRTGRLRNSNTLSLNGQDLHRDLEDRLGQTVFIENDANCFALAEAVAGAAEGAGTVFGVILGTGVGGGIVFSGRVHRGRLHIGGEWGHHTLHPEGRDCYCGRRGCVESYLSGPALESSWQELSGESRELADLVGDTDALESDAGRRWKEILLGDFGIALANVINILDPDVVVLGGGVSNIPFLYTEGAEAVRANIFSDVQDTPILQNRLGDSAGVIGAALLNESEPRG